MYYILNADGSPCELEPAAIQFWGAWMEVVDRTIAKDRIADLAGDSYDVSTMFLGLAPSIPPSEPPLLWETTVFDDERNAVDALTRRYASVESARAGHAKVIDLLRETVI